MSSIQKQGRSRVAHTKDTKSTETKTRIATETTIKEGEENETQTLSDGLASPWTKDETFRALITRNRKADDIPFEEFPNYFDKIEETLQQPNEAWALELRTDISDEEDTEEEDLDLTPTTESENTKHQGSETRLFTFIREYSSDEYPHYWYVVITRELEEEEQIEILDAFPTTDPDMVDCFRKGEQQAGPVQQGRSVSRLVH